jgi:hypothetical protein
MHVSRKASYWGSSTTSAQLCTPVSPSHTWKRNLSRTITRSVAIESQVWHLVVDRDDTYLIFNSGVDDRTSGGEKCDWSKRPLEVG